jgi:predicted chitinase
MLTFTTADLREIAGGQGRSDILAQTAIGLSQCFETYGIKTAANMAGFLGQIVVESDYFKALKEYASGWAYDISRDRHKALGLGNTHRGDGPAYKGMGLIETTGKTNQSLVAKHLGIYSEWLKNPAVLASFPYALMSAGYFWKAHNLNHISALDNGGSTTSDAVTRVTRIINGGHNALQARIDATRRAWRVILRKTRAGAPKPSARPVGFISGEDPEAMSEAAEPATAIKVESAQQRLKDLNYFPGAVDGKHGAATTGAIATFQADKDLKVTGELDESTTDELGSAMTAPKRVTEARANATDDDMRAKGSETVKAADDATFASKLTGVGGAAALGGTLLDGLTKTVGGVDQAKSTLEQGAGLVPFFIEHAIQFGVVLAIIAVVFGAYETYRAANRVRAKRLEDHRTGANMRL